MMNMHRLSTLILVILILTGLAAAVVVNIDGSNLTPLSWFNASNIASQGRDDAINSTKLNKTELNSTIDRNLSNYTNTPSFVTNETVNPYSFNASNATSVLPNASIPLSAMNLSSIIGIASVYNATGGQSITQSVNTRVVFDTEVYDPSNEFASNNYTAPVSGMYPFAASIHYSPTEIDKVYTIKIAVNDVFPFLYYAYLQSSVADGLMVSVSGTLNLNAGDKVSIYAFHTSAASVPLQAPGTFFDIYLTRKI